MLTRRGMARVPEHMPPTACHALNSRNIPALSSFSSCSFSSVRVRDALRRCGLVQIPASVLDVGACVNLPPLADNLGSAFRGLWRVT